MADEAAHHDYSVVLGRIRLGLTNLYNNVLHRRIWTVAVINPRDFIWIGQVAKWDSVRRFAVELVVWLVSSRRCLMLHHFPDFCQRLDRISACFEDMAVKSTSISRHADINGASSISKNLLSHEVVIQRSYGLAVSAEDCFQRPAASAQPGKHMSNLVSSVPHPLLRRDCGVDYDGCVLPVAIRASTRCSHLDLPSLSAKLLYLCGEHRRFLEQVRD